MERRVRRQFRASLVGIALLVLSGVLLVAATANAGSYAIAWFPQAGEVCTSNAGNDCSVVTPGY